MALQVTDPPVELGKLIRYHRRRAGLSRATFSDISGVGATVVYELEHGKRSVQLDVLQRILQTLNMHLLVEGPFLNEYLEGRNAAG